jgi:hypothetical protein
MALVLLATSFPGCADPEETTGTYDELLPLAEDGRDYAVRMSLFQFGGEVGGVMRFYQLSFPNTPENPFVVESLCSYFGPLTGDPFVVLVEEGPDNRSFAFSFTFEDGADRLTGELCIDCLGGGGDIERYDVEMVRASADASRTCERRDAFTVEVSFPEVSPEQAPDLSLASGWAAYLLDVDDNDNPSREIARVGSLADRVPLRSSSAYVTAQRYELPVSPPRDWLSDPEDNVQYIQYGLGYMVLFNDGDQDGRFTHGIQDDEVLAISSQEVLFYAAGPPAELPPEVRGVFFDVSDIAEGYDVYAATSETNPEEPENAWVVSAFVKRFDTIRLQLVPEGETASYPILLPEEPPL